MVFQSINMFNHLYGVVAQNVMLPPQVVQKVPKAR